MIVVRVQIKPVPAPAELRLEITWKLRLSNVPRVSRNLFLVHSLSEPQRLQTGAMRNNIAYETSTSVGDGTRIERISLPVMARP